MFFSTLKWILISLTLIFLVHHLYMFLLNTLTVPKIKDLVNKPNQQYKDIFDTLGSAGAQVTSTPIKNNNDPVADELSSFLNDLKKNTGSAQKKSSNDFESYTSDSLGNGINGNSIGGGNSNYSLY
jgi:predicted PurR-regulated permease PerM